MTATLGTLPIDLPALLDTRALIQASSGGVLTFFVAWWLDETDL